jgi:hypothetical protein
MLNEDDLKNLEKLITKEDLTLSDLDLIKVSKLIPGITVVQSEDRFDWVSQKGDYCHMLAEKDFDKAKSSSLDEFLDINTIDISKLGKISTTYMIKGGLEAEADYGTPDLSSLGLKIKKGAMSIDLSKYKLYKSRRVLEFYGYTDQGARIMNWAIKDVFEQKATVAYLNGQKDIAIVCRSTFSGKEEQGTRLYLHTKNSMIRLDLDDNSRLLLFMKALERIHDYALKESSSTLINVSKRLRIEELKGYA